MDFKYYYISAEVMVVKAVSDDGSLAGIPAEELIENIQGGVRGPCRLIALDLTEKRYLNSSGLGDLIMVYERFHEDDISLALIGVSENIGSLLEMIGVIQFFFIVSKEDELIQE